VNGLPYYKAYPRDFFEGTIGMDFEVKAAYRLLLDLIYMHGGRLADDPRFIAGHLGCSVRRWTCLREAIIATGKISVSGGYLGNYRADKELDTLKTLQEKQRENGRKPKVTKHITEAMAQPRLNHTEPEPDTDKQQPREANQSGRERLLSAMGADPISGLIGPNGRRLGTVADTTEAGKWSAMGLTLDQQCAVIAERCAAMRRKDQHWTPGRFAYFTGAMADLAAAKAAPVPTGTAMPQSDRDAKLARYAKIAGQSAS
jgi:uncharacterized protein YdaU (DUF1376 family)